MEPFRGVILLDDSPGSCGNGRGFFSKKGCPCFTNRLGTGLSIFYYELVLGGLGLLNAYWLILSVWVMKVGVFEPSSESALVSWERHFLPCQGQRELIGRPEGHVFVHFAEAFVQDV